jgi:predicted DNA-binding protein
MIALKKKTQATKCSNHLTISLIAHTAKIVAKILRRRIEKKIEEVLGEDQFGFRRGKGNRVAIGMLRVISERTLEIDEDLRVCFIDWKKAFDRVNWTKLMQILKGTGIDWCERRLIGNLYMAQSVKVRLNCGETRSVKIGRGVRQGCCLSPVLFNLYSECLTKEALEGFGDFKIGRQIIHTVKYADELVLLAKEEKVLQNMIDKLIEIGGCYGTEINVEETKVMRISRHFLLKL